MIIYQQKSPEQAFIAFDEIYRRFSQNVFSFLIKKLKNEADAEDLLQKIFIKIHESKHLYSEKYKFEQWLFVIARTSLIDHFRSNKRYEKKIAKLNLSLAEYSAEYVEDSIAADIDVLNSASQLNENQKELLKLKYIDELSYQEIASVMNKSENSLRKMVSRLLVNLRKGVV